MPLDFARVRQYLGRFDFPGLFTQELGWDRHKGTLEVAADGQMFTLTAVAEKRGMVAFQCPAIEGEPMPPYALRRKIEQRVAKSVREHLIVFTDAEQTTQIWQWVKREHDRPAACREHTYRRTQPGDALFHKLQALEVTLEEEEDLTLIDTGHKVKAAFDVDRITKRFYDRFKAEHTAFLKFIKGFPAPVKVAGKPEPHADLQWYTSLMLNRLMFVYFIQKKGFLDGDTDYLRNRLGMVRKVQGNDKFQSFYRYFLLRLFHDGLGKSAADRGLDAALEKLLGRVPYLDGGFFEVHELERRYTDIDIPDRAFEKLFDFFDQYQWHLDERPLRKDNEINPDVVGYIFEKYINQKQMGAYYTKEDITEYISKNTIIPYLFDAAKKKCAIAFQPDGALWRLLRDDPDRYIYPAVRHGVIDDRGDVIPLPADIAAGLDDVGQRGGWNRRADAPYALPTETWREHVARRQRCLDVREKLRAGEVTEINDLVTLNLDIWQFARDAILNAEGPELLRAFWKAIAKVTVLDPTCGSGAFLFAALRILETLYSDCLERMERFVEDLTGTRHRPDKYSDFKELLAQIAEHPSDRYFILKTLIINNLYGVDIMEEAVEICKLRLFLKLVAQVESADQIEPLPDVDFNIRAGNTLVGYTSLDEIRRAAARDTGGQAKLPFGETADAVRRIEEDAEMVEKSFRRFRDRQVNPAGNSELETKQQLRARLAKLDEELDRYLAGEYGVNVEKSKDFAAWKASHEPFHWFVDFYGIISAGGFDVIIGNPPWAEYSTVKKTYTVTHYQTERSGNLHALCTERSLSLRSSNGSFSFIVQLPLSNSSRMDTARSVLRNGSELLYMLPFDDRPGKLFDGLQHCRSVIFLSRCLPDANGSTILLSRYQRWATEVRTTLFQGFAFTRLAGQLLFDGHFPKIGTLTEQALFAKVCEASNHTVGDFLAPRPSSRFVFYQEATGYWVKAVVGLPYYAKNGTVREPAHGRYLYFDNAKTCAAAMALLNSTLFYAYFIAYGDCFHLSAALATCFPIPSALLKDTSLAECGTRLDKDLKGKAERTSITLKTGVRISYAEFLAWKSKPIIDDIDRILAEHYGFTDEELDFIINYDIKYRMGADGGDAEGK